LLGKIGKKSLKPKLKNKDKKEKKDKKLFKFLKRKKKGETKPKKEKKGLFKFIKSKNKKDSTFKTKYKIKNQLITMVLILALIPMIVVGIINYNFEKSGRIEMIKDSNLTIAKSIANQANYMITNSFSSLETLAIANNFSEMETQEATTTLMKVRDELEAVEDIYVIDNTGNVLVGTKTMTESLANELYFVKAKGGNRYVSNSFIDDKTKKPGVMISIPVKDFIGQVEGVIAAKLNVNELSNIAKFQRIGDTGIAYIVDRTGAVIGHEDFFNKVLKRYNYSDNGNKGAIAAIAGNTDVMTYDNENNEEVIGAYTKVAYTNWGVVVEQNVSEIEKNAAGVLQRTGIITLLAGLVIAVLTAIISQLFAKPINNLAKSANRIKDGDMTEDIKVTSKNEIGLLQGSFNSMIESLTNVITKVSKRKNFLNKRMQWFPLHPFFM